MNTSRERNRNIDLNNIRLGTSKNSSDTKTKTITTVVVLILMLVSVAGPVGIVLLFIIGIFAFIMGIMYFVLKSQAVGADKPGGAKNVANDFMRSIREKSEKEGDPMFKEARANQKRGMTAADYSRIDRCSHEESLKSLLEAGIIDHSEYAERMRKLDCSVSH